jgi:hypothetical protein
VPERQGVDAVVVTVVCCSVVEEASYEASLVLELAFLLGLGSGRKLTEPAYWSITSAKPSKRPTVYMLLVPTSFCPFFAYHICRFPPPLSGPVARKSTSTAQFECSRGFSVHMAPRTFPG